VSSHHRRDCARSGIEGGPPARCGGNQRVVVGRCRLPGTSVATAVSGAQCGSSFLGEPMFTTRTSLNM
jgi:hypothetical protein